LLLVLLLFYHIVNVVLHTFYLVFLFPYVLHFLVKIKNGLVF
jgi:hypothetical protein